MRKKRKAPGRPRLGRTPKAGTRTRRAKGYQGAEAPTRHFLGEVEAIFQGILGPGRLQRATKQDDEKHGTDYYFRHGTGAARIAYRIRSYGELAKYGPAEFTVRKYRPLSGNPCELEKYVRGCPTHPGGCATHFFYGHAGKNGLALWFVGDLQVFRDVYLAVEEQEGKPPGFDRRTKDAILRVFNLDEFPPVFVIDCHETLATLLGNRLA